MAKGNFGKSFVEGLNPYLQNTSNLIARMIMQNAQYDREDEQRQAELKQKGLEQEQSSQSLRNIIQGGRYQQELVPSIKEKTPSKFPMQNFGNKYETVNTTQETFKPMSALEKAIAYGGLQDTDKKALDYYEKGNKPKKVIAPKKLATATGYNSKGEQEVFIKYDDGSEIRIPTGFYKKKNKSNSTGEGSKKFDPQKFNKTLDGFTDGLVKINGLRKQYKTDRSEFTRSNINLLNETNEALLHTIISDDEEMNTAVNDFYDELKKTFPNDFRDVEVSKQNELKGKFLETIKQRAIEGDLPMDKFRALSLWIQFKYGYQY